MGFGKDGKGVIFRQRGNIILGTLSTGVTVKQAAAPVIVDSLRVIKSTGVAHLSGGTFVDGDGPIELWLVSDDLSVAEISEAIGATAGIPLSREDRIGNERTMRPVFYLGILPFVQVTSTAAAKANYIEWERNIRWTFGDEASFSIVAFNAGTGQLTTGGRIDFHHIAYGVWVGA